MNEANIYQRIVSVRKAVAYIQKDKTVSTGAGNGGYKAVTHDAVVAKIRDELNSYGIVVIPSLIKSIFHQREDGGKQRIYEGEYRVSFVNAESPSDFVEMVVSGMGQDSGDKGPGKAISYATKYALLKMFLIETGDDDESRVQQERDFQNLADEIAGPLFLAEDIESLQSVFKEQHKKAVETGNKDVLSYLIKVKDKRKKELSG